MAAANDRSAAGRAAPGDTVWVLVNHIKPSQLDVHCQWVYDILMPAVQRVAPDMYRTVRFLEPHAEDNQAADGTHRTVWIMDPVVGGEDVYSYETLLTHAYGAEQAQVYLQRVDDWRARPQTGYILKQSAW